MFAIYREPAASSRSIFLMPAPRSNSHRMEVNKNSRNPARGYNRALVSQTFNHGDCVRWVKTLAPEYKNAEGRVVRITPSDVNRPDLVIYDVQFEFGLRTLFCDQLEPAPTTDC